VVATEHMYAWFARNVVFRLQERLKGHASFRILAEMKAVDRFSGVELNALRAQKLRSFIDYSYAHVPYIRIRMQEAGIAPSRIQQPADLSLLPVMTKADIRKNREALRSRIAPKLAPFTTGGSTGDPLIFDLAPRRVASRVACRQRVSEWWGVSVGVPEIALWGSPVELTRQDRLRGIRDRLLATRLLSAFEMNRNRARTLSPDVWISQRCVPFVPAQPETGQGSATGGAESRICHWRGFLPISARVYFRNTRLSSCEWVWRAGQRLHLP
jgi:phenylacetate-CoA ligase